MRLTILNLASARFECTFGRGCDGICCRDGRPPIYEDDAQRIEQSLPRLMTLLRPEAARVVARDGYVSRRRKAGQPMARVVGGWCVFFNQGCALHRLGASEGAAMRYKPWLCAVFPLAKEDRGKWYVRQRGYRNEIWALPCLDPIASSVPAAASLGDEIALVKAWEARDDGS